ncbi:IS66 family insertion sequence element accessory protein TnpB [Acetobacter ascendens]|uniref:IS66 family insertion sequence element accessory protein TnpB n=1 Tax=Acetobacter ascendens TaxID=481146 RepID=UPI0038D21B89
MWYGQRFGLYYKVLERGCFPWPLPAEGVACLTAAQMALLWESMEWRRPFWSAPPFRVA